MSESSVLLLLSHILHFHNEKPWKTNFEEEEEKTKCLFYISEYAFSVPVRFQLEFEEEK